MSVKALNLATLAGQRWFAGKDRPLERVLDAGSVALPGGALRLAQAVYGDQQGSERYLLTEPAIDWPQALRHLSRRPLAGSAGELRLRPGPAVDAGRLPLGGPGRTSIPSVDQSNTLVEVDGRLLIKLYRRPLPGVHPEVEIGEALTGTGAPVARHYGALELVAADGRTTVIGALQEFIAGAQSGWEWPIGLAMADLSAAGASPGTLSLARATGSTLARLHTALADVLGTDRSPEGQVEEHRAATATIAELAGVDDVSSAALAAVAPSLEVLLGSSDRSQRIHGDMHIAQFLQTAERLVVIDFEGNPTLDLESRRARNSPLRDLATLRRSFDHVATAAARRVSPVPAVTRRWSERVLAEVSAGYREAAPVVEVDATRLHAFEVSAELRELRYARAVLPEWAYVAHAGLERLAAGPVRPG